MPSIWVQSVAVLTGAVVAAGVAFAQPGDAGPQLVPAPAPAPALDRAVFDQLIEDLDSSDLTTRELASDRLRALPGLALDDVLLLLAEPEALSPEQERRLERIAAVQFQSAPKAGLGVQFARIVVPRGVPIDLTVDPGRFPAAALLRAGDVIIEADGRPVRGSDDLRAAILSHQPGEVMPARVIRGEEELELALPLGNFAQLGGPQRIEPDLARRCVRLRLDRLMNGAPDPVVLGGGISAQTWSDAGDSDGPRRPRRSGADAGAGIAIGGAPRTDPVSTGAGTPLGALVEPVEVTTFDPEAMSPEQRLEWYLALERTHANFGAQIRTTRQLRNDPSNTALDLERLDERVRDLLYEQRRVAEQLQALRELGVDP